MALSVGEVVLRRGRLPTASIWSDSDRRRLRGEVPSSPTGDDLSDQREFFTDSMSLTNEHLRALEMPVPVPGLVFGRLWMETGKFSKHWGRL